MRTLEFYVNDQKLSKKPNSDFSGIVAGTKGYLRTSFRFNSLWRGYACVAVFRSLITEYPVPIVNGSCMVPSEVTDRNKFHIRVMGRRKDGSVLTTNEMMIEQIPKEVTL